MIVPLVFLFIQASELIASPTTTTPGEESNHSNLRNNNNITVEKNHSVVSDAKSANEKRLASAFANNALADVVQDFEKTLERSRTKSTSVEREPDESLGTREEQEVRRRTFDSRATTREKFFQEYGKVIYIQIKQKSLY